MYQSDAVASISAFVACLVFSVQHIYMHGLDTGLLILNVLMLENKNEKLNIKSLFRKGRLFGPEKTARLSCISSLPNCTANQLNLFVSFVHGAKQKYDASQEQG